MSSANERFFSDSRTGEVIAWDRCDARCTLDGVEAVCVKEREHLRDLHRFVFVHDDGTFTIKTTRNLNGNEATIVTTMPGFGGKVTLP